jgi:hypothetical protein
LQPERVTIDVTVVRDYLDGTRPRHLDARALFLLARGGSIEIEVAPQGYRTDVRGGALERQISAFLDSEGIRESPQVARVSEVTYPSETLFPGACIERLPKAWDDVLAKWKSSDGRRGPGPQDRWHVETHLVAHRDVFVTDDGPLLAMCRRLSVEHHISIRAMRLADYIEGHRSPASR